MGQVGKEADTNDVELENLSDNESTSDDSDVGDLLDIVRIDPNCPKHGQHKQEHLQEQQKQKLAPPRPAPPSQNNQSGFREYRIPKIWRPCIAELGEEVRKCDVPVTKREKAVRPAGAVIIFRKAHNYLRIALSLWECVLHIVEELRVLLV